MYNKSQKCLTWFHNTMIQDDTIVQKVIKAVSVLLFWCRGSPYNLSWSISTSPEAIPKWSLFPLSPNPLLSLMMVLLLLLLFSLLHLFLQKSSLQHFKEPLINWLSLLLKLVCVHKCIRTMLQTSNYCVCVCVCACVCVCVCVRACACVCAYVCMHMCAWKPHAAAGSPQWVQSLVWCVAVVSCRQLLYQNL